jgi:hypothetical protein
MQLEAEATEIHRLWKYIFANIYSKQKHVDQKIEDEVTAEYAAGIAPPPPQIMQQQQQQQRLGKVAGADTVAEGPKVQEGKAKTSLASTEPPAPLKGQQPHPHKQQGPGHRAVTAVSPLPHNAIQAKSIPPAPSLSGGLATTPGSAAAVHVTSFLSTGETERDNVVAALHMALSVSMTDPLETALSIEQQIHQHCLAQAKPLPSASSAAGISSAYLRRAFMVWSLLSPESETFSPELRELVLEGAVSPESIAKLDSASCGTTAGSV